MTHGGGLARVDIEEVNLTVENDEQLMAVNEALSKLATKNPERAELVKLRYFVGMTIEEAAQVLELLHRMDELLQVLEPPRRFDRLVLLPHLGIAGFVEHDLRELAVIHGLGETAPAREILHQPGQRPARRGFQFVGLDDAPRGL